MILTQFIAFLCLLQNCEVLFVDFYERLKQECKKNNTTVTALLKEFNITTGRMSSWSKGGKPNPKEVKLFADKLNVSTDFLITGKEYNPNNKIILSEEEKQIITKYRYLSNKSKLDIRNRLSHLYDMEASTELSLPTRLIKHSTFKVSAGVGEWMEDKPDIDQWDSITILDTPQSRKADFALTIEGDSMMPDFEDGDIILVKRQDAVNIGQICIYTIEGDGYIKKFGGDRLISLNDKYDDIIFKDYQDIHCKGLVIGKV